MVFWSPYGRPSQNKGTSQDGLGRDGLLGWWVWRRHVCCVCCDSSQNFLVSTLWFVSSAALWLVVSGCLLHPPSHAHTALPGFSFLLPAPAHLLPQHALPTPEEGPSLETNMSDSGSSGPFSLLLPHPVPRACLKDCC